MIMNIEGNLPENLEDWSAEHLTPPYVKWGDEAVKRGLAWPIAKKWLERGRPFSLIALKALSILASMGRADAYLPSYFKGKDVLLKEAGSVDQIMDCLQAYLVKDQAPTVTDAIRYLRDIFSIGEYVLRDNGDICFREAGHKEPSKGKLQIRGEMRSKRIVGFKPLANSAAVFKTKFGGQPDWIDHIEWPRDAIQNEPMMFIAQIKIDNDLFPGVDADAAYIFIAEDKDGELDTFDPEAGTNQVVLQHFGKGSSSTSQSEYGPTVSEQAYGIVVKTVDESVVVDETTAGIDVEALNQLSDQHHASSKIGGVPEFMQNEEYPASAVEWQLLLQLDPVDLPFDMFLNDYATIYAYIAADGSCAKLLWQCE